MEIVNNIKNLFSFFKTNKDKTVKNEEIIELKGDTMALSDRQIEIILGCFDDSANTTSTRYIIKTLRNEGFEYPERVIRDALLENLLYVDSIELSVEDWQNMMLALDEWGESLWYEWGESS